MTAAGWVNGGQSHLAGERLVLRGEDYGSDRQPAHSEAPAGRTQAGNLSLDFAFRFDEPRR